MLALRMRVGLVVNPRMSGFAYSSSMDFLSAPSAKSFTFNSSRDFIGDPYSVSHCRASRETSGDPARALPALLQRRKRDCQPLLYCVTGFPPQLRVRLRTIA